DVGKSAAPMARGRHGARASNVEHLRLSVSPRETLSIGFRVLVSRHPAIQTTGLLTLAPAGLSPAEHASLAGHTTGQRRFPASGSRTRPHAFVHGTSCPNRLRRTSP